MAVDPSITSTGYSVFRVPDLIAAGCISTFADQPEPVRISIVLSEFVTVIREHGVE